MSARSGHVRRALAILIVATGVAAFVFFLVPFLAGGPRGPNPFEYSLAPYTHVDPGLILFREVSPIQIDLDSPRALAVDSKGAIYVAGDGSVVKLDSRGKRLLAFDLEEEAKCIAVGIPGEVFLGMRDHVEVYDETGRRSASWIGMGEKAVLTSLAVGPGNVFIADAGQRLVWHFDRSGKLIGPIDGKGPAGNGKGFIVPSPFFDVALGPGGTLWIVNPGEHEVGKYGSDGIRESVWGEMGIEIDRFCG